MKTLIALSAALVLATPAWAEDQADRADTAGTLSTTVEIATPYSRYYAHYCDFVPMELVNRRHVLEGFVSVSGCFSTFRGTSMKDFDDDPKMYRVEIQLWDIGTFRQCRLASLQRGIGKRRPPYSHDHHAYICLDDPTVAVPMAG